MPRDEFDRTPTHRSPVRLRANDKWDMCRVKIENIGTLPESWDDAGAPEIDTCVLRSALQLIDALQEEEQPPPLSITPSPDGSIILGWLTPDGLVEAEVESGSEIFFIYPNGTCFHMPAAVQVPNPTQMPDLAPVTRDEWDITRCVECGELGWTCGCTGPKEAA